MKAVSWTSGLFRSSGMFRLSNVFKSRQKIFFMHTSKRNDRLSEVTGEAGK